MISLRQLHPVVCESKSLIDIKPVFKIGMLSCLPCCLCHWSQTVVTGAVNTVADGAALVGKVRGVF